MNNATSMAVRLQEKVRSHAVHEEFSELGREEIFGTFNHSKYVLSNSMHTVILQIFGALKFR